MHRSKPQAMRNKIDLSDPGQVRSLKKRLGISTGDLHLAIGKVGNSIAALSKEFQKATPAVAPVQSAGALDSALLEEPSDAVAGHQARAIEH
ncbi:MAG: DUF3606 domain-containing protein [Bradyrhizobium sp.]|nr:DUF3606 domain-containing protein [Bradyrhizobium sp.]